MAAAGAARDAAVSEADEALLGVLAEAAKQGECPTSAEVPERAQGLDPVTFRTWF